MDQAEDRLAQAGTRLRAATMLAAAMVATCAAACGQTHDPERVAVGHAGQGGSASSAGGSGSGGTGLDPGAGQGGSATSAGQGGSATGGGTGGRSSGACMREPREHRSVAEVCDDTRPPGDALPDFEPPVPTPPGYCVVDAECTEGKNGRCEEFRGDRRCTYDQCMSDSDCASGGPCGCSLAFWSDANACLLGNCHTDADCPEPGYCSPTLGSCGNYAGVVGYYCRTCDDECVDDRDCVDPSRGAGYCAYSPEVSHWVCSYSHCVG
jgi:hypothetical protein